MALHIVDQHILYYYLDAYRPYMMGHSYFEVLTIWMLKDGSVLHPLSK